jgi:hypothetical protein
MPLLLRYLLLFAYNPFKFFFYPGIERVDLPLHLDSLGNGRNDPAIVFNILK